MKRILFFGFMCVAVCLALGMVETLVQAQSNASVQGTKVVVPRLIRFSGVVRQAGEKPARGVVELSFSLFKEESGGEPLWFESQTVEVDAQGRYHVLLGAMHPDGLPMDLFTSGEARWLSIMVGKVEQPRVLLVSVPYALKAGDAESLGGKPATAYVAAEQLKEQVASAMSDPKIGLRTLNTMVMASSGGSDTPPALINETVPATFTCTTAGNCVTVTQNGTGNTLFATQTAVSGSVSAVRGETTSPQGRPIFGWAKSTTGGTFGVWGQSASVDGAGVFGSATSATGQTYGLWGQSASVSGAGLYGSATAATGTTYGIFGSSSSTAGAGIRAQAMAATGNTMGLRVIVNSAAGTAGVFDNLAGGKLISARTTGLVEKFSVLANGNVTAAGALAAASASFSGAVTAGSFMGNGAGLTNITAASAVNTDTLDGFHAAAFQPVGTYALLGTNTFAGTQTIGSGDLSVSSGNISLPMSYTASSGVINLGGSPFLHANGESTFVGIDAGNFNTTGASNTAFGYHALMANTGFRNTATGNNALSNNSTGDENTASGGRALAANTEGDYNTANGYQALYSNTTGSLNTASGWYALRANTVANGNTASGYLALSGNTDGWYNTAMGRLALSFNCTGAPSGCAAHYNTALGDLAGVTANNANANVTGAKNTFLGAYSGPGTPTQLTNATAVGYRALVSASNSLVLGATGAYSVNVGIGTETPAERLDVVGNIKALGSVAATSFAGDGSGLTNITAASATTAATATNALALGGMAPSGFATVGSNTFTGNQTVTGNLTLSGSLNSGLKIQTNATSPNLIGGYAGNYTTANVVGAVIGGGGIVGTPNRITDDFGTVGGGESNLAGDDAGTTSDATYATVGGGKWNRASGQGATIAGGWNNQATASMAAVSGGNDNLASGVRAVVPGGNANTAQGYTSFAAGNRAKALHDGSFVWGDNTFADISSTGDNQFVVRASGGAIFSHSVTAASFSGNGSGLTNVSATSAATAATATNALALGGVAPGGYATVGSNSFIGDQAVTGNLTLTGSINGGLVIQSNATSPNMIGGYSGNSVTSGVVAATIGGGGKSGAINRVTDSQGTVGGGVGNRAGDDAGNTSDKEYATVGGGFFNTSSGDSSTVAGGYGNNATGDISFVGGGNSNIASGTYATVGGGLSNSAAGREATVPGGSGNSAAGWYTLAAGSRAKANHQGAFVWGDSTNADVASTANNQFIVRASGGVWFGTTSSPSWPAGSFIATSTGGYLSTGGTWTNSSDRNLKGDFTAIDTRELLAKLIAVPMQSWRYKAEATETRHLGPTAQDFYSAFGLGADDKHIATVDADGVALAAIQALFSLSLEKDQKIEQLTQEMAQLRTRLARLERGAGINQ